MINLIYNLNCFNLLSFNLNMFVHFLSHEHDQEFIHYMFLFGKKKNAMQLLSIFNYRLETIIFRKKMK